MVKLVYCICRKPGLSREAFIRYWAEVHGPIGARIPGLRKLAHSYAMPAPGDRRLPDYDGMAELWFDDLAALLKGARVRGVASLYRRRSQFSRPDPERLLRQRGATNPRADWRGRHLLCREAGKRFASGPLF